jgi:hypothetical protein
VLLEPFRAEATALMVFADCWGLPRIAGPLHIRNSFQGSGMCYGYCMLPLTARNRSTGRAHPPRKQHLSACDLQEKRVNLGLSGVVGFMASFSGP